jgi:hypothetical protein
MSAQQARHATADDQNICFHAPGHGWERRSHGAFFPKGIHGITSFESSIGNFIGVYTAKSAA